ncbi:hypothetical protein L9F63_021928 [Diploptera punctata]|uniref:CWH43-like N-terminal domain-containing protein n=1 Tax=Diploptera punctata TaxID=6984 RepID=A0AAD7ZMY1_DIPPU|nr:hypothetical protein L9F63_021928 [Diploptera punctata]
MCVYVRYLEVKHYPELTSSDNEVSPRVNKVALVNGLLSCLGLDLVANFQETNVISVHLLGAVLCFGAGTIYFIFQVWLSNKMPDLASRRLVITRAVFVAICILSMALFIIGAGVAVVQYDGEEEYGFMVDWDPEMSGLGVAPHEHHL